MDDATLFFSESDGALLAAISPDLRHILVCIAVALWILAAIFSDRMWVIVSFDFFHHLKPWHQAPVYSCQLLLTLKPASSLNIGFMSACGLSFLFEFVELRVASGTCLPLSFPQKNCF